MGNFYANITLRTSDRVRVMQDLRTSGRQAYLSEATDQGLVVFDRGAEEEERELALLAANLSGRLDCAALAIVNHDDSVLTYQLYERGNLIDEYVSAPHYFDDSETIDAPPGGDPALLGSAFGVPQQEAQLALVLRMPSSTDDGFTFEIDRHARLNELLGLPVWRLGPDTPIWREVSFRRDSVSISSSTSPNLGLLKLSWHGGRLKGNSSILIAAAAPRTLCAIR